MQRHVLRVLQLDVFAIGKIDSLLHTRANNVFAELFVISIVKTVPGKLPLHLICDGDKEGRNIVPEKIDELIIGDDDQNIRLGSL